MTYLSDDEFRDIYAKVPRLCVDLVIQSEEGILLALRSTEPFKGMWNTPGGTLYKNETLAEAGVRIAKRETGLDVEIGECLGYAEYLMEKRAGAETHSVSVFLEARARGGALSHDENTSELRYFKEAPPNLIDVQKKFF